jgi:hypothetical protein
MFCEKCGAGIQDGSLFCNQCGRAVTAVPGQRGTAPAPYVADGETSGKALASLLTGIFGLILFPIAIGAIILGHMSRSEIRKSNGRLKGDGMATAGLVMDMEHSPSSHLSLSSPPSPFRICCAPGWRPTNRLR